MRPTDELKKITYQNWSQTGAKRSQSEAKINSLKVTNKELYIRSFWNRFVWTPECSREFHSNWSERISSFEKISTRTTTMAKLDSGDWTEVVPMGHRDFWVHEANGGPNSHLHHRFEPYFLGCHLSSSFVIALCLGDSAILLPYGFAWRHQTDQRRFNIQTEWRRLSELGCGY